MESRRRQAPLPLAGEGLGRARAALKLRRLDARRAARRDQRVGHQHGDRHLADAAGHRGDRAGARGGFLVGDVADRRVFGLPLASSPCPATRLMPTSMTIAPGLTQSPRTISALPTAATSTSARRATTGRSRVREWAMVTVQWRCEQQLRHRLAHDVGAADDDRLLAFERLCRARRRPGRSGSSRPPACRERARDPIRRSRRGRR